MTLAKRESSIALVQNFIITVESSAVDDRHTPAIYARYLTRVIGESGILTLSPQTSQVKVSSSVPGDAQKEEDRLAPMSLLEGGFWDNYLMPGMWSLIWARA